MRHHRVFIFTVFLVASVPFLFSPGASRLRAALPFHLEEVSIPERLNRVRTLLQESGLDQAIRELKEILALDPGSAEGHMLLGIAYRGLLSAEMIGEAKAELRHALSLDPDLVWARFYLARIYLDFGRTESARQELQKILSRHPENPYFLSLFGETERQLGNPGRSLEINRKALEIEASFVPARYYLGLALLDLGERERAIEEMERAVQSGAHELEVHLSLGSAYLEESRVEEALPILHRAEQMAPDRPDLRIQLARAYRLKGLLGRAEEQLKLTKLAGFGGSSSPFHQKVESDLHLEWGLLRLQQGNLEQSARAFQQALEVDTNNGAAHRHLAEVFFLQGLHARSLESAVRAKELGSPLPEEKWTLLQEKLAEAEGKQGSSDVN